MVVAASEADRAWPRWPPTTGTSVSASIFASEVARSSSVVTRRPTRRLSEGDSSGSGSPEKERFLADKTFEVRGHVGSRPEINGAYATLREHWSGRPMYRNRRSQVYLLWSPDPPRWRIVPRIGSLETLAYCECGGAAFDALPCMVSGPWYIVQPTEDGVSCLECAEADEKVECVFMGQTVVVSGRSGHNQRLNGIFNELPEDYGTFPAYFDKQKHMYIYRRLDRPVWVISNRLGPAPRTGRGIIFAEVEDDAVQPFTVTRPWTVNAWGPRPAEVDPNISVFLRPESIQDGPPSQALTVRSQMHPEVTGVFALQEGQQVKGQAVYSRAPEDPNSLEMHIFWDGERWCIDDTIPTDICPSPFQKLLLQTPTPSSGRRSNTAVRSQRQMPGCNLPEHALWIGVEVLRGGCDRIEASLLASLRGRRAEIAKRFS